MEAVPRLPMLSFDLKTSTENVSFGQAIKTYIGAFYGEDPESYNTEISNLESLRAAALRPPIDVSGVQLLKRYYCQLHFLKSRFPMEASQSAAINFGWKDPYSGLRCNVADIRFEIMCILYNIGAIHTQLGSMDSRTSADGMKMACTHFQCAAWAFQTLKESYYQMVSYISPIEVVYFMQQVSLAQAQECILEKSMMDNRKATIIAKVAVQVVDFYKKALVTIRTGEETAIIEFVERKAFKEWTKYLNFKIAYHKCIALLFQGQQAEEQQKMGERVAFYQAASEQLEEARKLTSGLKQQKEIAESLAFTLDVVEGKKKAAKNENEFIYHEQVPEKEALQEVKGASLVKGIPFNINDVEVSGPDFFAKLVPMEAHEAASLYSERKAQLLRHIGEMVENKDQSLAEFMSSMQLDVITQMRSATGLPQELVDRAAALSAKPTACQELIGAMGKLSNSYQEVESMLKEINELLKEEEQSEKEYQELMGKRPPSIIATDLAREAAKYREAHTKANDSNQNLHKAMTTHVANLKILAQPLLQLQQQIPAVEMPNPNVDEEAIKDLEMLISKVEEMRTQRAMLWTQFRECVHQDDITNVLVTNAEDQPLDKLFQQELDKHKEIISYIEQNATAQENILKVLVDVYARSSSTRKYLQDIIQKRASTVSALITSFDSYEDLLTTANKGIEFYNKLETNVAKLLQRIKSACKVQQEEREQILAKNLPATAATTTTVKEEITAPAAPKLKDYLDSRNKVQVNPNFIPDPKWPSGIRPTPVGSEENDKVDDLGARMASLKTGYYQYYQNKANNMTTTTNSYQTISSVPQIQTSGDLTYPTSTYTDPTLGNYAYQNEYPTSARNTAPSPASYVPTSGTDGYYQYGTQMYYGTYPDPGAVSTQQGATNMPTYSNQNYQNYSDPQVQYSYPAYSAGTTLQNSVVPGQYQYYTTSAGTTTNTTSTGSTVPYGTQYAASTMQYPTVTTPNTSWPASTNLPSTQQSTVPSQYPTATASSTGQYGTQYSTDTAGNFQYPNTSTPNNVWATGGTAGTIPSTMQNVVPSQYSSQATSWYPVNTAGVTGGTTISSQYPTAYYSVGSTVPSQYPTAYYSAGTTVPNTVVPSQYPTSTLGTSVTQTGTGSTPLQNNPPSQYGAYAAGTAMQSTTPLQYPDGTMYSSNVSGTVLQNNVGVSQYPVDSTYYTDTTTTTSTGASNIQYPVASTTPVYQVYPPASTPSSTVQNYPSASTANQSYSMQSTDSQNSLYPYQSSQASLNSAYYHDPNYAYYYYQQQQDLNSTASSTLASTTVTTANSTTSVPAKESNMDLLSGLDFTISQAPLVPQQKPVPPPEQKPKIEPTPIKTPPPKTETPPPTPVPVINKKPLNNSEVKKIFQQELERFEKFVETLGNKTLSGPTNLDLKWKEIVDKQDSDVKKVISVARCYPMKNRFPDILPYDDTRVELKGSKDDYMNASWVKNVGVHSPLFIVTQAPLISTFGDFWMLCWEQHVELVVCVMNSKELANEIYWPQVKGKDLTFPTMVISLMSENVKPYWTERLISITVPEKRESRVIMQLQFTSWPGSLIPNTPDVFVNFVKEVITFYYQQRNPSHPVVVHCGPGIGRSGLLCILMAAILEVTNNPTCIPDLVALTSKLTGCRKNILRDREHLKFAFEAFLCYMKQILQVAGHSRKSSDVSLVKKEDKADIQEEPSDPLSTLDPFWASKKSN